jgi:ribosomal protein S18 acetylase RimI-like enzyme
VRARAVGEDAAVRSVVRRAWFGAYAGIFSRGEMDAVFAGRIDQDAPWGTRRRWPLPTLVGEVDGYVVGMASRALLSDGDGELVGFYVLPEFQGRGVGRALWDTTLEELRGHGCARMWVWALERATQSVEWYRRHGCVEMERGEFSLGRHSEPSLGLVVNLHDVE